MSRIALLALACSITCAQALAQDAKERHPHHAAQFNKVTLSAQAEREVPNDLMTAVLAADAEAADAATAAAGVNRAMREALALAQEVREVKARTLNYQTWPVYDKARIVRWRVRQELRLESRDFARATELIGKLQSGPQPGLQVAGISTGVSAEARKQAENALIVEAIAAFHERAAVVREAQKAKGYRVRELQIGTGGGAQPRLYAAPRAMASMSAASAPAVEPGTTTLQVSVSGTIQLD